MFDLLWHRRDLINPHLILRCTYVSHLFDRTWCIYRHFQLRIEGSIETTGAKLLLRQQIELYHTLPVLGRVFYVNAAVGAIHESPADDSFRP